VRLLEAHEEHLRAKRTRMYHTAFPAIFSRSRRRTQQHPVNVPAKEKKRDFN